MEQLVLYLFEKYPVLSTVLAVLVAAHALAIVIVNLTPTPKDNEIVRKVYKIVEWLAGIVTPKSKEK